MMKQKFENIPGTNFVLNIANCGGSLEGLNQGTLTTREGSVRLTSLYQLVKIRSFLYRKYYLLVLQNKLP
jgi:hypothetical protein